MIDYEFSNSLAAVLSVFESSEHVVASKILPAFRKAAIATLINSIALNGAITQDECNFINELTGLQNSLETYNRYIRTYHGNLYKANLLPHVYPFFDLLIANDNVNMEANKTELPIPRDGYGSWSMLKLFYGFTNRFCMGEAGSNDTIHKIQDRNEFFHQLAEYIEKKIENKRYAYFANESMWFVKKPVCLPIPALINYLGGIETQDPFFTGVDLPNLKERYSADEAIKLLADRVYKDNVTVQEKAQIGALVFNDTDATFYSSEETLDSELNNVVCSVEHFTCTELS